MNSSKKERKTTNLQILKGVCVVKSREQTFVVFRYVWSITKIRRIFSE